MTKPGLPLTARARHGLLGLPLALALMGTGCASRSQEEADEGERYLIVHETGSLIPRRVKIGRAGDAGHNLKIESGDSPTLNQMARRQMLNSMPRERSP